MEMGPIINGGIAFAAVLVLMVLNIPKFKLLIKSADTFAFRKKALGIAKKATKAIPISTNSICL